MRINCEKCGQFRNENHKCLGISPLLGKARPIEVVEKMRKTKLLKFKTGESKVWNKGLTNETDERVKRNSRARKGLKMPESLKKKLYSKEANEKRSKSMIETLKNPKIREKYALAKIGEKNPFYGKHHTEEHKKMMSKSEREFYLKYPEKHPNRKMRLKNKITKPQNLLFSIIKKSYKDTEAEYPIKTHSGMRYADVGIPNLQLDLEFDGNFWHKDKERDLIRDRELLEVGWKTIRFNESELDESLIFEKINTESNVKVI